MKPDSQIEDEAIDYFLDENLDQDSQMYLMDRLETDDRLSDIFDSVILRAIEVSKEGLIEGPGNGKSDSIPARLSDGEFVFSKEAVDVIGVQKLEAMHNRAKERASMGDTPEAQKLAKIDAEIDELEING